MEESIGEWNVQLDTQRLPEPNEQGEDCARVEHPLSQFSELRMFHGSEEAGQDHETGQRYEHIHILVQLLRDRCIKLCARKKVASGSWHDQEVVVEQRQT